MFHDMPLKELEGAVSIWGFSIVVTFSYMLLNLAICTRERQSENTEKITT